jgi:hypothetical protein
MSVAERHADIKNATKEEPLYVARPQGIHVSCDIALRDRPVPHRYPSILSTATKFGA